MSLRRTATVLWALLLAPAAFAACDKPVPLRFPAGTNATSLNGGIPRGATDCFTLGARAEQRLTVTQRGRGEGNIVVQLYRPGWKIVPTPDGPDVRGKALTGAGEGDDAPSWSGPLPESGAYLLIIGTTRGGGEYRLRVEIQ